MWGSRARVGVGVGWTEFAQRIACGKTPDETSWLLLFLVRAVGVPFGKRRLPAARGQPPTRRGQWHRLEQLPAADAVRPGHRGHREAAAGARPRPPARRRPPSAAVAASLPRHRRSVRSSVVPPPRLTTMATTTTRMTATTTMTTTTDDDYDDTGDADVNWSLGAAGSMVPKVAQAHKSVCAGAQRCTPVLGVSSTARRRKKVVRPS